MKMPTYAPGRARSSSGRTYGRNSAPSALEPQGCNPWELLGCAAAIAACTASGPGLVPCLLAAAPGCVKCVS